MDTLSIRLTPRLEQGQIIIEVQEGDCEPYEVFLKTLRRKPEGTPEREPSERVLTALRQLGKGETGRWVTRSTLLCAVRALKARELGSVLGELEDAGSIEREAISSRSEKREREYFSIYYRAT